MSSLFIMIFLLFFFWVTFVSLYKLKYGFCNQYFNFVYLFGWIILYFHDYIKGEIYVLVSYKIITLLIF